MATALAELEFVRKLETKKQQMHLQSQKERELGGKWGLYKLRMSEDKR